MKMFSLILTVVLLLVASQVMATEYPVWVRTNDAERVDITHYTTWLDGVEYDGGPYPLRWDISWANYGDHAFKLMAHNAIQSSEWTPEWYFTLDPPLPPLLPPTVMYLEIP